MSQFGHGAFECGIAFDVDVGAETISARTGALSSPKGIHPWQP